ncbi:hypothetical protein F7D01_05145 [Erythrobacter sp. 3-20A1M]|uniref:helix-turn-helix transcriptional regulator n=1 Tax=Erythrobacter sp. 3-20A1M TaxID=2653850 RepID=UPI001BFBFB74|nr:LuxR C-terminal-related transcriptional regulator [Erythrobacter sp. 3-20A1M]QWC56558.1 hypothetical protein F7D01_05145 [Erythrobacter sp. 3-20A1M]
MTTPTLPQDAVAPLAIVAVQLAAALYFVIDGVADWLELATRGAVGEVLLECLVALALFLAVALGAKVLRDTLRRAARQEEALAIARGAMADLLDARFAAWSLSPAQADVAVFALKGCSVAEIAAMRGAAEGTVRSQLSQVYAKAGVTSQAMLMALFIEELV